MGATFMSDQPGVLIFFDMEESIQLLDREERGDLLTAILAYGRRGEAPDFSDNRTLQAVWAFIRPSIDRSNKKYRETVEKRRIAGLTSDFRRNYAPKNGISPDDQDALDEYICQHMSTKISSVDKLNVEKEIETKHSEEKIRGEEKKRGVGRKETIAPDPLEETFASVGDSGEFEENKRTAMLKLADYR